MNEQLATATNEGPQTDTRGEITPELVCQVAQKVYELWQRELAVERERQRLYSD